MEVVRFAHTGMSQGESPFVFQEALYFYTHTHTRRERERELRLQKWDLEQDR